MLVIVLYVGLPLSGALKDVTQGVLDPPNLMPRIVAMALAYSAYLAEIFRSGITPSRSARSKRRASHRAQPVADGGGLVVLPQASGSSFHRLATS